MFCVMVIKDVHKVNGNEFELDSLFIEIVDANEVDDVQRDSLSTPVTNYQCAFHVPTEVVVPYSTR